MPTRDLTAAIWQFVRLNGGSQTAWRSIDLPHDFMVEKAPARDTAALALRNGTWRFRSILAGQRETQDERSGLPPRRPDWTRQGYDDSKWTVVRVPSDWRTYPSIQNAVRNATIYGNFRRKFVANEAHLAADARGELRLALGAIADSDVVYVNGRLVGSTGSLDPGAQHCHNALTYRSYLLPANTLQGRGREEVVALQVAAGSVASAASYTGPAREEQTEVERPCVHTPPTGSALPER